ncbi:MAG: DEAD/DEAH box helicase [Bradymonadales bacterium]|nr:MAG: DEAD/DEAH box helicase [Bradymonadales bacterium]
MGLAEPLLRALDQNNFKTPTPIQTEAIPAIMRGQDVIASAQTGSGKTMAFCLPLMNRVIETPSDRILILTPTRELAMQIREVVKTLSRFYSGIQTCVLIGGSGMSAQLRSLRSRPAIVIATPGRLLDHCERRSIQLKDFNHVVLDESDRMLDMGFEPAMKAVFKELPSKKQCLLFSATLSPEIQRLANNYLREPVRVQVGQLNQAAPDVEQSHLMLSGSDKNSQLIIDLQSNTGKTLIFTRTKRRAESLSRNISKSQIENGCLHGDRSQSQRNRALQDFRSGRKMVLVATDVASRGLDVEDIERVINFDLPNTREDYIHRIGRTGRAGERGFALSYVTPEEARQWRHLQSDKAESTDSRNAPKKRFRPKFRFRPKWAGRSRQPGRRSSFQA